MKISLLAVIYLSINSFVVAEDVRKNAITEFLTMYHFIESELKLVEQKKSVNKHAEWNSQLLKKPPYRIKILSITNTKNRSKIFFELENDDDLDIMLYPLQGVYVYLGKDVENAKLIHVTDISGRSLIEIPKMHKSDQLFFVSSRAGFPPFVIKNLARFNKLK